MIVNIYPCTYDYMIVDIVSFCFCFLCVYVISFVVVVVVAGKFSAVIS